MSTLVESRLDSLLVELDACGYRVLDVATLGDLVVAGVAETHPRVEIELPGVGVAHVLLHWRSVYFVTGVERWGYVGDVHEAVAALGSTPDGSDRPSNAEYEALRARRAATPSAVLLSAEDAAERDGLDLVRDLLVEDDHTATGASVRAVTRLLAAVADGAPVEWAVRRAGSGARS